MARKVFTRVPCCSSASQIWWFTRVNTLRAMRSVSASVTRKPSTNVGECPFRRSASESCSPAPWITIG
ncbi:hypothetical protein D3C83_322090 [compost metagenome]